jgi:D-alanyl-D-alanine carboxypeptidase
MKIKNYIIVLFLLPFFNINAQIDTLRISNFVNKYSEKSNNTAILIHVEKDGNTYDYATGIADREKKINAKTSDMFEIGSASKMFTAIAILQLIDEGKLTLDTPISKFYKNGNIRNLANLNGENHFNKVTVEMLLHHTSGFVDYLNAYGSDENALKKFSVKDKIFSFDEIINLAVNISDANFEPGSNFKYSNTGYIILGDIITKISNEDWRSYIQTNIFDKCNMNQTYFGSHKPKTNSEYLMKGYYKFKPFFMPPTLAGSAGEVISSLNDLSLFLKAWQGGKLLSKKTINLQYSQGFEQMYPEYKSLKYGYGVMSINNFYGHAGQTFGFQSYVAINPKTKTIYIIGTNDASIRAMDVFMKLEGITF